ncbi:RimK family alpha-L-glutamate ligase [Thalassotalea euphylliae]|uniref:ATP-grasp domain-containing protein n=1 Tax=Thalassotalea euphylliae TaxID=1655234 RepID=UPI0036397D07
MKRCAILTMDSLDDFEAYDDLLEKPLAELGWQMEMVSWREPNVNWDQYDAVVIRSPWDYQDDADAFMTVLEDIDNSSAHLENSIDIVRWNIDKLYLKELEDSGVAIVPTIWRESFDANEISTFFSDLGVDQIVFKPRISANADNTFWVTKTNYKSKLADMEKAFATRNFMVQPFVHSVIEEGEFSMFYFDGHYSHAILKTPKKDDFRVQEEHGGQLLSVEPESELLRCAKASLEAIDSMPLYARVDLVRYQDSFALMEAELIEPSLYFNMDEKSAARFAKAFVDKMQRITL